MGGIGPVAGDRPTCAAQPAIPYPRRPPNAHAKCRQVLTYGPRISSTKGHARDAKNTNGGEAVGVIREGLSKHQFIQNG